MTRSKKISSKKPVRAARRRGATTIGPWQIVAPLGEGRWTQVFRARPQGCPADWPSDYAVKVIKPSLLGDPLAKCLLQREAYVGRQISSPHLIPILSTQVDATPYFVVMPYLEGSTLEELLQGTPQLALPQALWIVRQTAEAFSVLHTAGWLHADVKPSNIFISPQGHATLIDLGLARRAEQFRRDDQQCVSGTPSYTAPEMYCTAQPLGPASDMYSLGVTLYQMLTGRLPFVETDPCTLAVAHMQQALDDPRKLRPQLPPRVAWLLRRMLAKEPLRRPTASELSSLLIELEIENFEEWTVSSR